MLPCRKARPGWPASTDAARAADWSRPVGALGQPEVRSGDLALREERPAERQLAQAGGVKSGRIVPTVLAREARSLGTFNTPPAAGRGEA